MIVTRIVDTRRLTDGWHEAHATAVDAAGNVSQSVPVRFDVRNLPVDVEIVTVPGTDPVEVKYRAGNTGKTLMVTMDAKHKGRVRVNGQIVKDA